MGHYCNTCGAYEGNCNCEKIFNEEEVVPNDYNMNYSLVNTNQ